MKSQKSRKRSFAWITAFIALALTVSSFALSENQKNSKIQTPESPSYANKAKTTGENDSTGAFIVTGGEVGSDKDYHFDTATSVLLIHPRQSGTSLIIQTDGRTSTANRINVTKDATIILSGIEIETASGPALEISGEVANVHITLFGDSTFKTTGTGFAALQKDNENAALTIDLESTIFPKEKDGSLIAIGGSGGSGIGGGQNTKGSNITIKDAVITATGGTGAAAIGSGSGAASGTNNSLDGGVMVASSNTGRSALDNLTCNKGIIFTGEIKNDKSVVWQEGEMYGNSITINGDLTLPANFTISEGKTVKLGSKVNLILDGVTLTNEGFLDDEFGYLSCGNSGSIKTFVKFHSNGGVLNPDKQSDYMVYLDQDVSSHISCYHTYNETHHGIQYNQLPTASKIGADFDSWYTKETGGYRADNVHYVYLNEHDLYAQWEANPFTVKDGTAGTDYEFDESHNVLNIKSGKKMTICNENGFLITDWRIVISKDIKEDVNLVLAGLNIEANDGAALEIPDDAKFNVNITLQEGTTNILTGAAGFAHTDVPGSPGLQKNWTDPEVRAGMLTINGTGKLIANGGFAAAGIGSAAFYEGEDHGSYIGANTSNITINSGTIEANGGDGAAGIGSGRAYRISGSETIQTYGGNCVDIFINGGTITATGQGGAGIGGGSGVHQTTSGNGINIQITNGNVTAIASGRSADEMDGAGIGGGAYGSGEKITISGGTVKAYGADGDMGGAGIGGGVFGVGSEITISGGDVTAVGGSFKSETVKAYGGAGIGGGVYGIGEYITIEGSSSVTATAGKGAAGIGGGFNAEGNNIKISGGVITTTGGMEPSLKIPGSGIGGGAIIGVEDNSENNILDGDAVVFATSGGSAKDPLEGFDKGSGRLTRGILFTRQSEGAAWSSDKSNIYGDSVSILEDITLPTDLTIESGKTVFVGKEYNNDNVTLTIPINVTLENKGDLVITDGGKIDCLYNAQTKQTGKVTTEVTFYSSDGSSSYQTGDQVYMANGSVQKYKNVPQPTSESVWYTQKGKRGKRVDSTKDVIVNSHSIYEGFLGEYLVTAIQPKNGTITAPEGKIVEASTVKFTAVPNAGYKIQGTPIVETESGDPVEEFAPTGKPNEYSFEMPASNVKISATFENIIYTISTTQPENGNIILDTKEAIGGDTVTFKATPNMGYQISGLPVVKTVSGNDNVEVKSLGDDKYSFTMPLSDVNVSTTFELIPSPPEPDPQPYPEPAPNPSINPSQSGGSGNRNGSSSKTGDLFADGAIFALLGATAGVAIIRKKK